MQILERQRSQKVRFSSLEEVAYLNLQRTAGGLLQAFTRALKPYSLTPTQYNVLRILRGARPEALTCGEVGARMITPEPDVTRLVDRLVARGLVSRHRDDLDRRVVRVEIAKAGLVLLAELDEPVADWLQDALSHMGEGHLRQLVRLLEEARQHQ